MDCTVDQKRFIKLNSPSFEQGKPLSDVKDGVDRGLLEYLLQKFESIEIWKSNCTIVSDTLCELRDQTSKLQARVEELEAENKQQNKDLAAYKEEVLSLKKILVKLEKEHHNLVVGQLAFRVDRALLDRVLKDSGCPCADELYIFSIKDLEKAIDGKKNYKEVLTEKQRQRANQQWSLLKAKLGWKAEHDRCVGALKGLRLDSAHPYANVDELKQSLVKVSLEPRIRAVCTQFIDFLKKLEPSNVCTTR